jgi:G3E family GTPase
VIINDYRNALIDAQSLRGLSDSIMPISGTCICCDSREELMATMATMTLGERDLVLLEANGTVDAPELIEALTADRRARRFSLPILIGVADAKRWQRRYWHNCLEAEQLKAASSIWLTRRDEVSDDRWKKVVADIRSIAPHAEFIDPDVLADRLAKLAEEPMRLPRRRFSPPTIGSPYAHTHHHHAQMHHVASMEIPLKKRLTKSALTNFLTSLPPEVIRAKGVAHSAEDPTKALLFQMVEGRDDPSFLNLPHPERLDPVVVLIGAKLPHGVISDLAARYLHAEVPVSHEESPPDRA